LEFATGDEAAEEGDATDDDGEVGRDEREHLSVRTNPKEGITPDDEGGESAKPIEKRDQLRHRDHFDLEGEDAADDDADTDRGIDQPNREDIIADQSHNHCEKDRGSADEVACFGLIDFAHEVDAKHDHEG
jgi:hypothetical protein